jgi:hypothetical protein
VIGPDIKLNLKPVGSAPVLKNPPGVLAVNVMLDSDTLEATISSGVFCFVTTVWLTALEI